MAEEEDGNNTEVTEGIKENVRDVETLKEVLQELIGEIKNLGFASKNLTVFGRDGAQSLKSAAEEMERLKYTSEGLANSITSGFGVITKAENSMIGLAGKMVEGAMGAEKATFKFGDFLGKLKTGTNVVNLFATAGTQMAMGMYLLAKATDKAMASFNVTTGATEMYGSSMIGLQRDLQSANISIDEITESYGSLINNFGNFNNLTDDQQESIATTTSLLGELGVATDTTSANYNTLMSAFQMTEEQAGRVQREMFVLAQEIGMPPQKMAEGFQQALPQLAAFGKRSTDVYAKLAVNAKKAGMEVGQLLKITQQFDTFEGAAQAVGKLNAILGGPYLSATRMIQNTDPTERMRMLSGALRDAGKSFDSMEYYERQATAAAMGLSDVNELALVMNGRFDLLNPTIEQSASDIEAMAAKTAQFNDVMTVMKNMLMSLVANLAPLVMGFKNYLGVVQSFMANYPAFKVALAGVAVGLLGVAYAASLALGPFGWTVAIISTLIVVFGLLGSYIGSFNSVLNETNVYVKMFKMYIIGVLASALAPLIIAVGIIYLQFKFWSRVIRQVASVLGMLADYLEPLAREFLDSFSPTIAVMMKVYDILSTIGYYLSYVFYPAIASLALFVVVPLALIGSVIVTLIYAFNKLMEAVYNISSVFDFFMVVLKTVFFPLYSLLELGNALYTFFIIGQSPSFVDAIMMVANAFMFLANIVLNPIAAIQNLFDTMKSFIKFLLSAEVQDVLRTIFDTGMSVVAKVFGYDNDSKSDEIAQARMDIEKAIVDSNTALKSSIDELSEAIRENTAKPTAPAIEINADLGRLFNITEKRVERKLAAKPNFKTVNS